MISVLIYSSNQTLVSTLSENVKKTIGIDYEIITTDSSSDVSGISHAYNKMAVKAKFDILCFVNEQIFFETQNWGKNAIAHLQDESIGLIGISGGNPKSKLPESWNDKTFLWSGNFIHSHMQDGVEHSILIRSTPSNSLIKQVVCISGIWMCTKRKVWEQNKFNEKMNAPHIYDLDFSLQVFQHYKIYVVYDILMKNSSEITFDKKWMKSAIALSNKWGKILPVSVTKTTHKQFREHHWNCVANFLDKLLELKFSLLFILKIYFQFSFNRYFQPQYFWYLFRYVVNQHKKLNAPN